MSAVFPIAALVQNCPDEDLKFEPKQRELIVRALLQAAGGLLNTGNAAHALLALKDCVRLEPDNFGALTLLATAHVKLGGGYFDIFFIFINFLLSILKFFD